MKTSTKLKIVGFALLALSITLIILGIVFGDHGPNPALFAPGLLLIPITVMVIVMGFSPKISKISAKLHSETMDHSGKDITEAANKTADVVSPSITKVTGAIKEGLDPQMTCKHCGKKIDVDSKFCKYCSKEQ